MDLTLVTDQEAFDMMEDILINGYNEEIEQEKGAKLFYENHKDYFKLENLYLGFCNDCFAELISYDDKLPADFYLCCDDDRLSVVVSEYGDYLPEYELFKRNVN